MALFLLLSMGFFSWAAIVFPLFVLLISVHILRRESQGSKSGGVILWHRQMLLPRHHSNAYNIFILILTIISLVIMVVMLLPLDNATIGLLQVYDNLICVIFLIDFFLALKSAPKKIRLLY